MRCISKFCNFAHQKKENTVKTNHTSPKPHRQPFLHALACHWRLTSAMALPVAALLWIGIRALPASEDNMRASVCLVDGQSKLCVIVKGDTIAVASDSVHGQGVWINQHWWWPSCAGRVLTTQQGNGRTDQGPWLIADSVPRLIAAQTDSLGALLQRKNTERKELQYYLRCHGVQDEGYQRIARYATKQARETDSLTTIYMALKAHQPFKKARLVRVGHYSVAWNDGDGLLQRAQCEPVITPVGQLGKPVILQTCDHTKPWAAYAVRNTPLKFTLSQKIFTVKMSTGDTLHHTLMVSGNLSADRHHDFPRLFAPDGAPVFTNHGKFIGVVSKDQVSK
mgnify:FL=1